MVQSVKNKHAHRKIIFFMCSSTKILCFYHIITKAFCQAARFILTYFSRMHKMKTKRIMLFLKSEYKEKFLWIIKETRHAA